MQAAEAEARSTPRFVESAAADILLEFVEAFTHTLLWKRELYPKEAFEPARLYGTQVRRVKHPGLAAYIRNTLSNLKPLMMNHKAEKAAIVVTDPAGRTVERCVIDFDFLARGSVPMDVDALQKALVQPLLRLNLATLPSLPTGSAFELLMYARDADGLSDFWVEAGSASTGISQELDRYDVIPCGEARGDLFGVTCFFERPRIANA